MVRLAALNPKATKTTRHQAGRGRDAGVTQEDLNARRVAVSLAEHVTLEVTPVRLRTGLPGTTLYSVHEQLRGEPLGALSLYRSLATMTDLGIGALNTRQVLGQVEWPELYDAKQLADAVDALVRHDCLRREHTPGGEHWTVLEHGQPRVPPPEQQTTWHLPGENRTGGPTVACDGSGKTWVADPPDRVTGAQTMSRANCGGCTNCQTADE